MHELTGQQQRILDFERQWWKYAGAKAGEIERQLGLSPVAYYRQLNEVIDLPAAMEHDPTLVRRLQRARTLRRRRRAGRVFRVAEA